MATGQGHWSGRSSTMKLLEYFLNSSNVTHLPGRQILTSVGKAELFVVVALVTWPIKMGLGPGAVLNVDNDSRRGCIIIIIIQTSVMFERASNGSRSFDMIMKKRATHARFKTSV